MYGIDVCVRPSFRGQGIVQALYESRKELVCRLGLKRLIAGCRIPGLVEWIYLQSQWGVPLHQVQKLLNIA